MRQFKEFISGFTSFSQTNTATPIVGAGPCARPLFEYIRYGGAPNQRYESWSMPYAHASLGIPRGPALQCVTGFIP